MKKGIITQIAIILALVLGNTNLFAQNTEFPTPGLLSNPIVTNLSQFTGTKYYIDDVAENGDGSFSNPFNDVNTALALAQPGDQVIIKSGTYFIDSRIATMRNGTANQPILVRAEDSNDRPLFIRVPGYGGEIFLVRHNYTIIDGVICDGAFESEDFNKKYWNPELEINERAFRNLVVFAHYGMPRVIGTSSISYDNYLGFNGDNSIIRNSEVRNNKVDGIAVAADNITIENCEIHHCLRGSENGPVDAHGIVGSHCNNLLISHCSIHHLSGDCIQVDPDIENTCAEKLWNNLTVEHTELYTSPLDNDESDWSIGEIPGENGIDTKTYMDASTITHRPKVTITNILVHGFEKSDFFSNRSVFNVKFRTDWTFNGVKAYNNQFVFRMRGEVNNLEQGGAHPTIANVLAYDNEYVFRFERMIENVNISHCTLGHNDNFFYHDQAERDEEGKPWAMDRATYTMSNCLFLATEKPYEAFQASNMAVGEDVFTNVAANDYTLVPESEATDAGETIESVTTDITGQTRVENRNPDLGAYEVHSATTSISEINEEAPVNMVVSGSNGVLNVNIAQSNEVTNMEVYNLKGQLLFNKYFSNEYSINEAININNEKVVIVKLNLKADNYTKKIIL